ncbi:hypothetical protein PHYPSEUDO_010332 [Phytophthora pseudosyringae]|uniref:Uncharacterized protein n=1 Tax=Phytophthora pseudosyringae TaxID=221518 RepID=A0A8T1W7H3_9STRA|nr:hypothetical protein PHYPSEUDO_010332 [Phytophthora pseudosyringae]
MDIFPEFNCGQRNITYNCSPYTFNGTEYYRTVICVEDTHMWTWSYFQSVPYVMMEQYESSGADCGEYVEGRVVVASEKCVKMINSTSYQSAIASMGDLGSESLQLFMDDECASTPGKNFSIESSLVANHSCYDNGYKFYSQSEYTSTDAGSASGSASSGGGGEGIVNPSSGSFGNSSDAGTSNNNSSSSSSKRG